jgi:hypothetical protein
MPAMKAAQSGSNAMIRWNDLTDSVERCLFLEVSGTICAFMRGVQLAVIELKRSTRPFQAIIERLDERRSSNASDLHPGSSHALFPPDILTRAVIGGLCPDLHSDRCWDSSRFRYHYYFSLAIQYWLVSCSKIDDSVVSFTPVEAWLIDPAQYGSESKENSTKLKYELFQTE